MLFLFGKVAHDGHKKLPVFLFYMDPTLSRCFLSWRIIRSISLCSIIRGPMGIMTHLLEGNEDCGNEADAESDSERSALNVLCGALNTSD